MKALKKQINPEISVIVPVYNEEGAVAELYRKITESLRKIGRSFEIIFINDGSTDKTLDILKKFSPITIINFRSNFGQTSALDAGIKASSGKYIITLDGDGQNDPSDFNKMLHKLESENFDVVSGWRVLREDDFGKKFFSKVARLIRRVLIDDGIHDSGCTLKVYRRECFENVDLFGEMHRFVPAILKIKGFKVGEIEVTHHKRNSGTTKYNWKRGIKGITDMLAVWFWKEYSGRPLHLFGGLGLIFILVSFVFSVDLFYEKFFLDRDLSGTVLTLITVFLFIVGFQFFVSGLLADISIKNYFSSTKDRPYVIREVINNKK